tara:strand:- start:157042 stop:157899 length:858 start_codon:yes stop_codon:yes gene_type:complete
VGKAHIAIADQPINPYIGDVPPQHEAKRRSGPEENRPRLQERFIMTQPLLMPKATAVWLVDNTALSFDQIAAFCTLHPLEVQGIADGDVAGGIMGANPIQNGQLTREEIEKAEGDPAYRLKLSEPKVRVAAAKRKGPRYTPISRRNERPNAIKWLVRNHPELKDAQIMRLVGTTKSTIDSVRESTHWNAANLAAMDPVTLGLCSQIDLDLEVRRASKGGPGVDELAEGTMLMTAEEALARSGARGHSDEDGEFAANDHRPAEAQDDFDADSVFSKLKSIPNDTDN